MTLTFLGGQERMRCCGHWHWQASSLYTWLGVQCSGLTCVCDREGLDAMLNYLTAWWLTVTAWLIDWFVDGLIDWLIGVMKYIVYLLCAYIIFFTFNCGRASLIIIQNYEIKITLYHQIKWSWIRLNIITCILYQPVTFAECIFSLQWQIWSGSYVWKKKVKEESYLTLAGTLLMLNNLDHHDRSRMKLETRLIRHQRHCL